MQKTVTVGTKSAGNLICNCRSKAFFATESAFLAVLFAFNLLSVYQARVMPQSGYCQPATLRAAVFVCGAILGKVGGQAVLRFSESGGGLGKHEPLIVAALRCLEANPPLFEARLAPVDLSGFAACEIQARLAAISRRPNRTFNSKSGFRVKS